MSAALSAQQQLLLALRPPDDPALDPTRIMKGMFFLASHTSEHQAMRVISLLVASVVWLMCLTSVPASAQTNVQTVNDLPSVTDLTNIVMRPGKLKNSSNQKTTKPRLRWSTKKRIVVSVAVGCLIATAIAVPVACGVHAHLQYERHEDYEKELAELIIRRLQGRVSRQEQWVQSRLNQDPPTPTQIAELESKLTTLQNEQQSLNLAYDGVSESAHVAKAAVNAYEAAFATTVPPPVVSANRAQLAALMGTNFFGINTQPIAASEADYLQFWVRDAVAMYGY